MPIEAARNTASERIMWRLPGVAGSRGIGSRDHRSLPPDDAPREGMTQPDGDEADEQVSGLDHPVVGTGQQAELGHAERGDDEAPDEYHHRESSIAAREEPDDHQNPEGDDEEPAERHVELHQRERMAGPEQDPQHHERDAEEADEQARDENDGLHCGLAS